MIFKKEFLIWLTTISAIIATLYFYTHTPSAPFLPQYPDVELKPFYDPTSQSNLNDTRVLHNHLSLTINFTTRRLTGSNRLRFISLDHALKVVKLDIRGLKINRVESQHKKALPFRVNSFPGVSATLGDQLEITLDRAEPKDRVFELEIFYETTENSTALNWLTKEQTSTKTQPYLFSQCEPAYCRTLAPLQDSPGVRSTYTSEIYAENTIQVYMSANITGSEPVKGTNLVKYSFNNSIAIPSYLIAIIAGNVTRKAIGPRTGVISEWDKIDDNARELDQLEEFITAVENYLTPYEWGFYNIVILPPSFPYGGMENPLLTFASPTIIVGDKSETYVALHEIAHSWTGNLITCKNWENFWLNEGFTVFLERKANSKLVSHDFYLIEAETGNSSMVTDMSNYGFNNSFSSLHPDLNGGQNPDDSFSEVPYEKGFQFLAYLESVVGEGVFQEFLRYYVHNFRRHSITYEQLETLFNEFISKKHPSLLKKTQDQVNWKVWVYTPGIPPVKLNFSSSNITASKNLAQAYLTLNGTGSPANFRDFFAYDPMLKGIFLQTLIDNSDAVSTQLLQRLIADFNITEDLHHDILTPWFTLQIKKGYLTDIAQIRSYLATTGRMLYILPLYRELNKYDHSLALEIFTANKGFYHPIASGFIRKILNI